jgi:hypothetical protein
MRRISPRRRGCLPRRHGRPRQDQRDQVVTDVAAALRTLFKLGPQQARDLALGLLEGDLKYSWRPDGLLVISFRLSNTIKGRSDALQRKRQKPRENVVRVIRAVLQSRHTFTGCKRL